MLYYFNTDSFKQNPNPVLYNEAEYNEKLNLWLITGGHDNFHSVDHGDALQYYNSMGARWWDVLDAGRKKEYGNQLLY